jgi:hypothetical protein
MLMPPRLTISLLPDELAIWRLPPDSAVPAIPPGVLLYSVTATPEEISIVGPASMAPTTDDAVAGWRAFVIEGPLDFSLVGVLDSMLTPLVEARVPVFGLSTYTTDYVIVRQADVRPAVSALKVAGHRVNA